MNTAHDGVAVCMDRHAGRSAFTLMETLAVLGVLALMVTLGIGVQGRTSRSHRRLLSVTAVQTMVERARLLADGRGGAVLTLHEHGTMEAVPFDQAVHPVKITDRLPAGWSASVMSRDQSTGTIRFWADGTCADVRIVLSGPDDARQMLRVLGLTGQVLEIDTTQGER